MMYLTLQRVVPNRVGVIEAEKATTPSKQWKVLGLERMWLTDVENVEVMIIRTASNKSNPIKPELLLPPLLKSWSRP
jgi:hypothetical protein